MASNTTAKWLAAVVVAVAILTVLVQLGVEHGSIEAATGVKVTPLTPVAAPSFRIEAKIPKLSEVQQCMLDRVVIPVVANPEALVQQPKIVLDANSYQVFLELLFTESSFYQWEPTGNENTKDCAFIWEEHERWEIRNSGPDACGEDLCVGLGQLSDSSDVCDLDRYDPFQNVYCSVRYFKGLVDTYHGDFTKAVAAYKGAVKTLDDGTVVVDPEHPHVVMLFDQDHLALLPK